MTKKLKRSEVYHAGYKLDEEQIMVKKEEGRKVHIPMLSSDTFCDFADTCITNSHLIKKNEFL